jgi:hypothetical protein
MIVEELCEVGEEVHSVHETSSLVSTTARPSFLVEDDPYSHMWNRPERDPKWAQVHSRAPRHRRYIIQRLRSLEGRVSTMMLGDIQGHDGPANRAQ